MCSVTVPAKASTSCDEGPLKAPFVTSKIICPVVPALIVTNSVTLGALVIVIAPEWFIVPAKATAKLADVSVRAVLVVLNVIAPVVALLIAFNCATV